MSKPIDLIPGTLYHFIENEKDNWIGGTLISNSDMFGPTNELKGSMQTEIKNITLTADEDKGGYLTIVGDDFDCGFRIAKGGIFRKTKEEIVFIEHGENCFKIIKPGG